MEPHLPVCAMHPRTRHIRVRMCVAIGLATNRVSTTCKHVSSLWYSDNWRSNNPNWRSNNPQNGGKHKKIHVFSATIMHCWPFELDKWRNNNPQIGANPHNFAYFYLVCLVCQSHVNAFQFSGVPPQLSFPGEHTKRSSNNVCCNPPCH